MIGALVLAAGHSQRFGSDKRVARTADGTGLLEATVVRYADCFPETTVVLRCGEPTAPLLSDRTLGRIRVVRATPEPIGLGLSIAAGVRASPRWSCACIALADMPWVRTETLARLIDAWENLEDTTDAALYPVHAGRTGHPVLFDRSLFGDLKALNGDSGATRIKARARLKVGVTVNDPGTLRDVDRPDDLGI